MTTIQMTHAAQVAQRIDNAAAGLVENLAALADIPRDAAVKAAAYYVRHRIVKLDPIGGRYLISHGIYTEADVIRRAALA